MTDGQLTRAPHQVLTVSRFELLRFFNSRRLTGMVAVILMLSAAILAIPAAVGTPYQDSFRLAEAFGFFVPLLAVALGLLFGADSLVAEFTSNTGHILLPNPMHRTTVVLGKFLASVASSWLALFVYYAVTFVASLTIFGKADFAIFPSFGYALAFTVAMLAFVYLISAVAPSVTASATAAFLILAIFFPWAGPRVRDVGLWNLAILTEAGSIAHRLLNPQPTIPEAALSDALITVALYAIVSLAAAAAVFHYRED